MASESTRMPQNPKKRRVSVRLPYPPSTNRLWAIYRGYPVKTREAREYIQTCRELLRLAAVQPLSGPVRLDIVVCRNRRAGDLDNRLKIVLDALNGIAYDDDGQIEEIHAYRRTVRGEACIEVTIIDLEE